MPIWVRRTHEYFPDIQSDVMIYLFIRFLEHVVFLLSLCYKIWDLEWKCKRLLNIVDNVNRQGYVSN